MEQERRHFGRQSREPPKQETTWNSSTNSRAASSAFDGRDAEAGTTVAVEGGTGAGTDAGGGLLLSLGL